MPLAWPVIRELLALKQRLNELADEAEEGEVEVGGLSSGPFCPAADLYETGDELLVVVEVPGVDPDSVDLQLHGDRLRVAGQIGNHGAAGEYLQMERPSGAFYRDFTLPGGIAAGEPSAQLERGVLTVRVPKRDGARRRRVAIVEEDP